MALSQSTSILHTGRFEHHLLTRKQKYGKVKKTLIMGLLLTSLVDMFSILVSFLLQTFSSSPEIFIPKDVRLANAMSGAEIKMAPVLSVSKSKIFLDSKDMGGIDVVLRKPEALLKGLEGFKVSWAKQNPGKPFPGEINVQADKEVSSSQVARIMGILNTQQYDVIQLAVMGQK